MPKTTLRSGIVVLNVVTGTGGEVRGDKAGNLLPCRDGFVKVHIEIRKPGGKKGRTRYAEWCIKNLWCVERGKFKPGDKVRNVVSNNGGIVRRSKERYTDDRVPVYVWVCSGKEKGKRRCAVWHIENLVPLSRS